MSDTTTTLGSYLIDRLYGLGVRHVFGVPGDFSLSFCKLLETDGRIAFVGTTREDTAGFAADGYARRTKSMGVVLVTHGVGALSTVNPIAGANAESSPVLVISGAPGVAERKRNPLIHHSFGSAEAQMRIFKNFTVSGAALDDLFLAPRQIDRVLRNMMAQKKPGYLELPRDLIDQEVFPQETDAAALDRKPESDAESLKEALAETMDLLLQAEKPAILAGVELHRHGIQNELVQLVEATQLPVAATIMGKSVIRESHPLYLGVYQGQVCGEATRQIIESSDMLLTLGVMFTDINLGMYTATLDPKNMVRAKQGQVAIKHHHFSGITLKDFTTGLATAWRAGASKQFGRAALPADEMPPAAGTDGKEALTMESMIAVLNRKLTPDVSVVADTGDCLFAAAELKVPDQTSFFASAFYTTMGFAVPAALGVNCASPEVRPLILVGDGAFQMTGTELSTFRKLEFAPIVLVINNRGYETERVILEGKFNDIMEWDYSAVCRMIGYGKGVKVETLGDFENAMGRALEDKKTLHVIDAIVTESSPGMRRLAGEIGRRMQEKA